MPRNWSNAVPEGNGSIPQQKDFESGQSTLAVVYQVIKELFDQSNKYWDIMKGHFDHQEKTLDKLMEVTRGTSQRLAGLEQDARRPRLAVEVDVEADTKTCERTEGVAAAVQAMHGDSCSANRVDPDPTCSTSFGEDWTGPSTLLCSRGDDLVGKGAAVPKPSLPLRGVLTNSRRWLAPHRKNLYNDEDHLRLPTSLVLPNRRDKFENFDSTCLVLRQLRVDKQPVSPLLAGGHRNIVGGKRDV